MNHWGLLHILIKKKLFPVMERPLRFCGSLEAKRIQQTQDSLSIVANCK
jgi:hypothetical protein